MKCCRTCLRCCHRPDGTCRCTMTQDKIPEDILDSNFCKNYSAGITDNSSIKYKDYEDESSIERTRSCEECKHLKKQFDTRMDKERPFCTRRNSFIVDLSLAGSMCGWFSEKKNK